MGFGTSAGAGAAIGAGLLEPARAAPSLQGLSAKVDELEKAVSELGTKLQQWTAPQPAVLGRCFLWMANMHYES